MWRIQLHYTTDMERRFEDESKRRSRFMLLIVMAAIAFFVTACQKKKPPVEETVLPMDRVTTSPSGSKTILHKTFSVTTSASFPFEIPAHAATPHLHGNYKSFVKQISADAGDDAANVDFLILKEDQYIDFARGRPVKLFLRGYVARSRRGLQPPRFAGSASKVLPGFPQ